MSSFDKITATTPSNFIQFKEQIQPLLDLVKKIASYVGSILLETGKFLASALKDGLSKGFQLSKDFCVAHPKEMAIAGVGIVAGMALYSIFSNLFNHRPAYTVSA